MIKKLLLICLLFCGKLFAQTPTNFDSSLIAELAKLMDSAAAPKSFVNVDFGFGNREFSANNNAINADQSVVNRLYFTPSFTYFHKSGFNFSITPYISNINGAVKLFQTAISPAYGYDGKKISTSVSYTHYYADNKTYNGNSTFQDEIYAALKYKKLYLQPVATFGFAKGNFREINLDSIKVLGQKKYIKDSTHNSIKALNVSLGVEHSFEFDKIFTKQDAITITPQLAVNFGNEKFTTTHINKIYARAVNRGRRVRSQTSTDNTPFAVQSAALSLTLNYEIGAFYIMPNYYGDYYLPPTDSKRLSSTFSISFGYNF